MNDEASHERVLGAVASALVRVDELRNLTAFRMPYPDEIQGALNRIVLHCLRQRARAPGSVPEMIRWGYQLPLGDWPLRLPDAVYPADGLLVDDASGAPTALCHEIALCAESGDPIRAAAQPVTRLAILAAERNQAVAFSLLREVLATHPMLTNDALNRVGFDRRLGELGEYLGDFYRPIGPEYAAGDEVYPCACCGTPVRRTFTETWWCEREECGDEIFVGEPVDWDAKVRLQGDRRHRQFVSGPDRAVLRVADVLSVPGVAVTRWPPRGPGGLRVDVPGRSWNATLVDWHNPALLGRAIAAASALDGVSPVTWVVAQYRVDADPDYLHVVRDQTTPPSETPRVSSEEEFTTMVREESRRA
ncbi:HU-CCDC81 and SPOR domain-containing protein [Actinomadura flavalba]|uniref:pPIWI_RE_Y domain-containing protein n=1 Tax=Actinomadura flavalba TaxID=1120938 RepID=UPI000368A8B3|nr:HU-CCDC81 and SPOR domain-containing protein [Actinomadura flavalba]